MAAQERPVIDLSERVALVTGASRGIGRAVALELARCGAKMAINDVPAGKGGAEEVAEAVRGLGTEAMVVLADVSKADQVEAMVKQVVDAWGHVDVLVNNAGITRDTLILRMSEEQWDAVLNVNLKGAFLCTRTVLRHMLRQRWGRIISISSIVALAGNPGQANYAASKAGLLGFTRTVAKEVGSRGVTVNALTPGFIGTTMVESLSEELKAQVRARIALERFGTPEDVAHAVAFLASSQASYITGQALGVDGGLSL
ncbi:MAG: 3-oxoacyl-[acyl-carrier-protein] reductase [Chloroflexi bacterium]|nr:3-oxoacyl-[acyl-carrier-protein] reductase [Chloroflexota bacterium]